MADVFVSYSREDQVRAAAIVRLLEDSGWDVFWDQELRAGTLWPKVLETELKQASCLVALWTETSIHSDWVRIESYEALKHKKLLPILLDNVEPPLEFRQTQTLDLIGWSGVREDVRVHRLLDDLRELTGAPHGETNGHGRPPRTLVPTIRRDAPHSDAPKTLPQRAGVTPPPAAVHEQAIRSATGSETATPSAAGREQEGEHEQEAPRRPATTAETARTPIPRPKTPNRTWLWGIGAAALITASWIVPRVLDRPTEVSEKPAAPSQSATAAPTPTTVLPPSTPSASPVAVTTPSAGAASSSPVAAPPTTAAVVATPKALSVAKPATRPSAARCVAIAEKFQQTGQLSAAEQQFLRSKECQS